MTRSSTRSALGPVGGATTVEGTLCFNASGEIGGATVGGETCVADVGEEARTTVGAGLGAGAAAGTGAGAAVGTGATTEVGGFAEDGAVVEGVGVTDAGVMACAGLGVGTAAGLGFTSSVRFLQSLDPKAGTAAGGDEARGAYLSLDASARLAKRRSSLPGSRRGSLAADGSMATDERREYESTWGPSRSAGDG